MGKPLKIDISFKKSKKDTTLYGFLMSLDDRGCWIKDNLYKAMLSENKENMQVTKQETKSSLLDF